MRTSPRTAILIPTVGEPTLETVVAQTKSQAGDAEIYILGFGQTRQVADRQGVFFFDLGRKTKKPAALNMAISQIEAERYIVLDADAIPEKDWFKNMELAFDDGAKVFCGSININKGNFWMQVYNFSAAHEFTSEKPSSIRRHLAASTMGFTSVFYKENGPFNEGIDRSEDYEWTLRAYSRGVELRFYPTAVIQHLPTAKSTFKSVLRIFFISGYDNWQVRNLYRHILKTPFVLRSPYLIFLLAPFLACVPTLRIAQTSPGLFWKKIYLLPFVYLTKVAWCYGVFWDYLRTKHLTEGNHD